MLKLEPTTERRVVDKVRAGLFRSEDEVIAASLDLLEQEQSINRNALGAAIAKGEAARARGDFVSAEDSRISRRKIISSYRPKECPSRFG